MKRFKIVCRAYFTEDYQLKRSTAGKTKKYMQRTYYYRARSKEHALEKLAFYRDIPGTPHDAWHWEIVSCEESE